MAVKKIVEEIKSLENIQVLVQTYEEIAASRMQRVKNSVLNNRNFLEDLGKIYAQVKHSYEQEISKLKSKSKKDKAADLIGRNGKTVSVFLSANTGLYGDIVRSTFELFLKGITGKKTDVVIVGKLGKAMFDAVANRDQKESYKFFELADNITTPEDFASIINYVVAYEQVIVYHGKFESILEQVPFEDALTGDRALQGKVAVAQEQYIFEPTLPAVVSFFESEILASIFEQSMHESSLSKFASRMINLDRSVVNIGNNLSKARFRHTRALHQTRNKKQLSKLASMSLWS